MYGKITQYWRKCRFDRCNEWQSRLDIKISILGRFWESWCIFIRFL